MTVKEFYTKRTGTYSTSLHVRENPNDYTNQNKKPNEQNRSKLLKRIPLERLMDLKVDYAFKQLFGTEKNKQITVVFLNAILQKTGRNRITDISFANTETGGDYADDKQSRLDLLVVTDTDERINVEIQFSNPYEMIERSIYYWSRVYAAPLEIGMEYQELRPVIAINILNFNLFKETERFHTSYHLYEDEEQFQLTDFMEFHFIEMTKLIKDWKAGKLDPVNSVLARWLLLLGMVDHRKGKIYDDIYAELEEIAMTDESLRGAFGDWEELSMTQEQKLAYESRLKYIMDEEAHKTKMRRLEREIKEQREANEKQEKKNEEQKAEIQNKKEKIEKKGKEIEREKEVNEMQELENKKRKEENKKQKEENRKHEIENEKWKEYNRNAEEENKKQKRENELKEKELEGRFARLVQRMLASGMKIKDVAAATGLTEEKIADFGRDMQQ